VGWKIGYLERYGWNTKFLSPIKLKDRNKTLEKTFKKWTPVMGSSSKD
jgi:hypothetical protein